MLLFGKLGSKSNWPKVNIGIIVLKSELMSHNRWIGQSHKRRNREREMEAKCMRYSQ